MRYFKKEYWSCKLIRLGMNLLPPENRNITYIGNCIKVGWIKLNKEQDSVQIHKDL